MARKLNITIREISSMDQAFLFEMLYQSIFVAPGSPPPDRHIIDTPVIRKYVEDWGKKGDVGFVAIDESTGDRLGAIWLRFFQADHQGYGYIDSHIPELGIAVDFDHRGQGIGTKLMEDLLTHTFKDIKTISLSVDPDNPAVKMYEKFGFRKCGAKGTSVIMRLDHGYKHV